MTQLHRKIAALAGSAPLWFAAAFCALASGQAYGQNVVERNLPEPVVSPGAAVTVAEPDYGTADETPFGVDLSGVRLIGLNEAVDASPPPGISLGMVPGVSEEEVRPVIQPFVGRPLSHSLIVQIQSALANVWKIEGFPFVSVTVPPQEVTSGVLTLRVIEFTVGNVRTENAGLVQRDLAGNVRLVSGGRIDARALEEDLDWLNRHPFRQVEGVFAPGDETAASDFTLKVTAQKPFSVFASWSNTGNEETGMNRWSIGGGLWLPMLNDMTVSYRFTGSDEAFEYNLFDLDPARKGYISHAARIDLPTLPRQMLTVAPSYVETNEFTQGTPFNFENSTFELPILYHTAVSNILAGHYWGDVYFGVEPKWLRRKTYFDGIEVAEGEAGLFNLVLGWAGNFSDGWGRTAVDARIKANTGGVVDDNDDESWSTFTGGRVTDASFVHADIDITRMTRLPREFSWLSRLSGVIANQALPDPERLGLGGFWAVRGYDSNDSGVDTGLFWRNELRLPTLSPLGKSAAIGQDVLSPFAFVDIAHGYDFALHEHSTLASTGLGVDYEIGSNLAANLTGAVALRDGASTESGDWTFNATLRVAY
ncbi:MAG: ShlB/FhaC/HecB family hemolysin secretion/activation protein [Rhizobiaceae bacterium]|nr:ShlB/FhaC/HecB family hemolysin secretion/activation protein [Rhizobiaceae bacterium]